VAGSFFRKTANEVAKMGVFAVNGPGEKFFGASDRIEGKFRYINQD